MGSSTLSMVETTMDETWSSWESLLGLGRMKMNFGDVFTMPWVTSTYSSSPRYGLRKEIELRDAMCSRLKMTACAWGPPPPTPARSTASSSPTCSSGRVSSSFSSFSSSSFSSPLLFSPFSLLCWLNVNE